VKQFYFFEEYADSMFLKKKTFTCCFSREGFWWKVNYARTIILL